ncbi:MAG: hypothetical protein AAF764_07500 [Pseudomonadota bacterium]
MFDIVTADKNDPSTVIDLGSVCHRQTGLFAASATRHAGHTDKPHDYP